MSGEWSSKVLEECIDRVKYPNKIPKKKFLNSGEFPVISQEKDLINGFWLDEKDVFSVSQPIIIFGDHTKIFKFIDFDFAIGADGVKILQPKPFLNSKYFHYYLITFPVKSLGYARHYRLLKELVVWFPPLPEQKRIVAILDEAFAGIHQAVANAEKNLANARELFESYLNRKLLKVASEYLVQTLSDVAEFIVDCEHKTAPTQDTGYPSIRTPNIGKGELRLDKVNRVSEDTYHLWTRRAKPMAGDLILAREAPAGNIGVIPEGELVCLGQRTVLIRPKKDIINSHYFACLILHPLTQKRLLSHSTGATVQHVNMKDIRNLPIGNLPSLNKQVTDVQAIREAKSAFNELETIYQQKLTALTELKQSILQKAFTGELTGDN